MLTKERHVSRAEAACKVGKQKHQKCIKALWATAGKCSVSRKGQRQEGNPSACRPPFSTAPGLNQRHNSFSTWSCEKVHACRPAPPQERRDLSFLGGERVKREECSEPSTSPLINNALSLRWLPALRTDPPSLSVAGRDSAQRGQCLSSTGSGQTNRGLLWPLISRLHAAPVQLRRARLNAWECFPTCVCVSDGACDQERVGPYRVITLARLFATRPF